MNTIVRMLVQWLLKHVWKKLKPLVIRFLKWLMRNI